MRLTEIINLVESGIYYYDQEDIAGAIHHLGGDIDDWANFIADELPNLVDERVTRQALIQVNDWLVEHGVPLTVIKITQDWNDDDTSVYKFEVMTDNNSIQ